MPLLCIAAALVAILLCVAYYCYRRVFCVNKKIISNPRRIPQGEQYVPHAQTMLDMIDDVMGIGYEEAYVTADDGARLFGKVYKSTDKTAPVRIMFHGYKSAGERDFCGGLRFAVDDGDNVIMVDQRAHGKSEGRCLTFGIKESRDCLRWIDYAIKTFGENAKIILVGISMGATTVLLASGESLPENVVGVVADCGFSSPREIIKKVIREDFKLPASIVYPIIRLGAIVFGRFDINGGDVPSALKNSKTPTLFIHGDDDRFVPYEMGVKNYTACAAEKTLLTGRGAGHALTYMVDKESYIKALRDLRCAVIK